MDDVATSSGQKGSIVGWAANEEAIAKLSELETMDMKYTKLVTYVARVMHSSATTLSLLQESKGKEGSNEEANRELFAFLAEDWTQLLLTKPKESNNLN